MASRFRPLLPAFLLALFCGWSGTFEGGAGAIAAGTGVLVLLLAAAFGAGADLDPLRLGRWGRWLLVLLWGCAATSCYLSPLPRSGRMALWLLPALLLLPAVVGRAWARPKDRTLGLLAVNGVAALLAIVTLARAWGTTAAATGLFGHHLLVVAGLLPLLPLAVAGTREAWPPLRWVSQATWPLIVGAILAARSTLGVLGLLVVGGLFLHRRQRTVALIGGLAGGTVLVLTLGRERMETIWLAAERSSWLARSTYWEAGWTGWLQRPAVGWGLGSTPWTLAEHTVPVPGVNPPGEVVGDLHSWPLQWLWETGALGALALLALVVVWWARRWSELRSMSSESAPIARAAAIGLVALIPYAMAGVTLGTTAPWVVVGVVVGIAQLDEVAGKREHRVDRPTHLLWRIYAVAAMLALVPGLWAHHYYDQAIRAEGLEEREAFLELALHWDPDHPLYRLHAGLPPDTGVAIAALWLDHGFRGHPEALPRAMALDPLGWAAPFGWLLDQPHSPIGPELGARAVLLEPRLVGSPWLGSRRGTRTLIAIRLRSWLGVDPGLRDALSRDLVERTPGSATARLEVVWDAPGEPSASRFLFRRRPWPRVLAATGVDADLVDGQAPASRIPSAAVMGTTRGWAFPKTVVSPGRESSSP